MIFHFSIACGPFLDGWFAHVLSYNELYLLLDPFSSSWPGSVSCFSSRPNSFELQCIVLFCSAQQQQIIFLCSFCFIEFSLSLSPFPPSSSFCASVLSQTLTDYLCLFGWSCWFWVEMLFKALFAYALDLSSNKCYQVKPYVWYVLWWDPLWSHVSIWHIHTIQPPPPFWSVTHVPKQAGHKLYFGRQDTHKHEWHISCTILNCT